MSVTSLCLAVGDSWLLAVPAVHYRLPFAAEVNRLCADPATRPDGIAVELGSEVLAATAAWLKEMGVGSSRPDLPCMLGLHRQEAGATSQTLFLSPTDSIVEAIRCALELHIPVYGVDLDTRGRARQQSVVLPDPTSSEGNIARYVEQNAVFADHGRDPLIDKRRELVMAARLKLILSRHRRVLFTGGVGHWLRLRNLLEDSHILPAPFPEVAGTAPPGWQRVVVHPLLAVPYMDLLPAAVSAYASKRTSVIQKQHGPSVLPDTARLLAEMLETAYCEHFSRDDPEDQLNRRLEDWEGRPVFEQMLTHLCVVKSVVVPSLFTILQAAQATMSLAFCERLASVLMQFPWARPREHPGLDVIALSGGEPGTGSRIMRVGPDGRPRNLDGGRSIPGEPLLSGGLAGGWPAKIDWCWNEGPPREPLPPGDMVLSWPPTDRLLTAMSLRAMEVARTADRDRRVVPFEGQLEDGLDIKATLRCHARGEERYWVRTLRHRRRRDRDRRNGNWEPIVWIFRPGSDPRDRLAVMGEELREFEPHVQNVERLRKVIRETGTVLCEQVGFGSRKEGGRGRLSYFDWRGVLLYSPSHLSLVPQARWMEASGYERSPICTYRPYSWDGQRLVPTHPVIRMYRQCHGVDLDVTDWATTLVRMAIPYAQDAVTVVAPDRFRLPPAVFAEATRRQVEVRIVPQSFFPREVLRTISRWHAVEPIAGTNGERFPEALTGVFGEPPTANRQLLPRCWW